MPTVFPAAIDTFTNPGPTSSQSSPSHSGLHANHNDAINALQVKVGADGSTDPASLDARVAALTSGLAAKVSGHAIESGGTPLAQRATLNFVGATVTDEGGKTVVQISGGISDIEGITAAVTAGTDLERTQLLQAAGAAQYRGPATVTTDFTLSAAAHGNRLVYGAKGSAQAVEFNSGHGLVAGDSGRIMQIGGGPITISKNAGFAAGDIKLSTGVSSAATINDGDVIDWEYVVVEGVQRLNITFRSAASASGGASMSTPYSNGAGPVAVSPGVPGLSSEFVITSITIPGNKIGANGWVDFAYATERTVGAGTLTTRLRVGDPVSGPVIAAPSAGTRISVTASLYSQGSLTSQRSSAPVNTGADTGTTTTVTSSADLSGNLTVYLTGVLSEGTDTATAYYLKALANNPDA